MVPNINSCILQGKTIKLENGTCIKVATTFNLATEKNEGGRGVQALLKSVLINHIDILSCVIKCAYLQSFFNKLTFRWGGIAVSCWLSLVLYKAIVITQCLSVHLCVCHQAWLKITFTPIPQHGFKNIFTEIFLLWPSTRIALTLLLHSQYDCQS